VQLQYQYRGSTTHVNSRYIPELGWYLLVEQDERESLSPLRQMAIFNATISVIVTLLVLGLTWYAIRYYQRRLEQMASTDKLTGLFNRQALDALLTQTLKDVKRDGFPLSTVMVDIDHFKSVNDQYGHASGDIVIAAVAGLLKEKLRKNDIVARWGGEEFLLLLRDCPLNEAVRLAEEIRQSVSELAITLPKEAVRVTVSAGIAEHMPEETARAFFVRADDALYRAKAAGRNRVEASGMLGV